MKTEKSNFAGVAVVLLGIIIIMVMKKSVSSYMDASYSAADNNGHPWQLCLNREGEFYLDDLISSTMSFDHGSYEFENGYLILKYDDGAVLYFEVSGEKLIFRDGLSVQENRVLFSDGLVFTKSE